MSIATILRQGVAIARSITLSVHVDVVHKAWTNQDEYGDPVYSSTTRKALVDRRVQLVQSNVGALAGQEVQAQYYVAFIEPLPPNGAPKRSGEPVAAEDVILLPGGVTGPIVRIDGFYGGDTTQPYYTQVYLG